MRADHPVVAAAWLIVSPSIARDEHYHDHVKVCSWRLDAVDPGVGSFSSIGRTTATMRL
jgi:hypothetical protein